MWVYNSKVGTFKIKQRPDGRFSLHVGDEYLGSYISPQQAADDVFMCATGYWPWDRQLMVDHPEDLSEWTVSR